MSSSAEHSGSQTLQALQTLYHDPDASAKKRANEWLQEFQHSVDAWQVCHGILSGADSPMEARLFASQTFRTKILYDLKDIPGPQLIPLRDSLIAVLPPLIHPSAPSGSRAILIQICTALADFGLQVIHWERPVEDMIEKFGKDPSTVRILLEFLKAWIEEALNPAVRVLGERVGEGAEAVLGALTMYIQASGVTPQIHNLVFSVMGGWLKAGDLTASQIGQTPLFSAVFEALASDELFDSAVDTICELIHETQEIHDNQEIIEQIIPRIIALRPQLEAHKEDDDRIRGYCRIFCEAGETYDDLIIKHPDSLLPLVEAILSCAAYPDLDIVPITFNFWYTLATAMGKQSEDPSLKPLFGIFEALQTVIIGHLHFPSEDDHITAHQRDDFRAFRHKMGDTLKDCCHVLGGALCLSRSYDLIVSAMQKPQPTWQEIEAPLFSMRSMGAEVDPGDDEVLPKIMDLLPSLPPHPRVLYAAILVIGRYTQWTDRHPQYIEAHIRYLVRGFEMNEPDVAAAAAMAMKFMCQDCTQHLVPYIEQLHQFTSQTSERFGQADMLEIWEALGYVVADMPPEQAAPAIQQFTEPLFGKIAAIVQDPNTASKESMQQLSDNFEQIDSFLSVIRTLKPVPEACYATAGPLYQLVDQVLLRYGNTYHVAERAGSVVRRGLAFFPKRALVPLLEPLLSRMVSSFRETGYASYLWIIGKTAAKFGEDKSEPLDQQSTALIAHTFEEVCMELQKLVAVKPAPMIPDVMDDFAHLFMVYLHHYSSLTIAAPSLQNAIVLIILALSCPGLQTILISLDVLGLLSQRMSHPEFQPVLRPIFQHCGKEIFNIIITGLVEQFPEEGWNSVTDIIVATAGVASPEEVEGWAGEALTKLPGHILPLNAKQEFAKELHEHLLVPGSDKLRLALNKLVRAARTARERGRQARKSLGS